MDQRETSASQETLISLRQLEPSPIELPDYEKEPHVEPAHLQRSSFLQPAGGGRGSSTVFYLTRLQKYSSYAFSVFASFHLVNTSLIPLATRSVSSSEKYLLLTRPYYQSFPLEPLLITLPAALHVASGVALRLHRRNVNRARYGDLQLARTSWFERASLGMPPLSWPSRTGYMLIPLLVGHALVNRIVPWVYEGGSSSVGLGFVAHGFAKHPILANTSYVALISVAASHFLWGISRWKGWTTHASAVDQRRKRWTINAAAVAVAALWMAGGLGVIGRGGRAEGWIGTGYDVLLEHLWL